MKLQSVGVFFHPPLIVSCGPQDVGHTGVATGSGAFSLCSTVGLLRAVISHLCFFEFTEALRWESYCPLMRDKAYVLEVFTVNTEDFEDIYQAIGNKEFEQEARLEANKVATGGKEEACQAIRKQDDGDIVAFKTNTGRELDYLTALEEAKAGRRVATLMCWIESGRDIIRSKATGSKKIIWIACLSFKNLMLRA